MPPTLREREEASKALAAAERTAQEMRERNGGAVTKNNVGPISERGDATIRWSPRDEFSRGRSWMTRSKFGRGPPGVLWRAVGDTAHVYRNTSRACGRVVALAARNLLHRGNITMLGMALTGVFSCGIYEGLLLTHPAAPQPDAWRFALHYALENMVPSVTWSTKPAHIVAAAYGTPLEVLCVHTLDDSTITTIADPEEAARVLAAQGWRSGRSIIAGYVCIAQVLRLVQQSASAGEQLKRRAMLGLEPPTSGVPERVIRLCGVQSDVTPLSLERYGPHILPVVETIPIDSGAHTSLLLTNWGFHESAGRPHVDNMRMLDVYAVGQGILRSPLFWRVHPVHTPAPKQCSTHRSFLFYELF
jgi:hypothetical protein